MRRTALGLGALAMMLCCGTAPAGAQLGTARAGAQLGTARAGAGDTTDAIVDLQSELSALMELGAFDSAPSPRLRGIHDEWSSFLSGLDRTDLIWWVQDSDSAGNTTLDQLRGRGLEPTTAVTAALGVLSESDYAALRGGGKISVRPDVYESALDDLGPRGQNVAARSRRSALIADSSSGSSGLPLILIIGVGVLAVLGMIVRCGLNPTIRVPLSVPGAVTSAAPGGDWRATERGTSSGSGGRRWPRTGWPGPGWRPAGRLPERRQRTAPRRPGSPT